MVSCLVCSSRKPTPLALASRWILQSVLGALTLSGFEWLRDCLWPADLTPSCLSLARQTLTLFSYTSYKLSVPKHGLKGFWRKTDVLVVSHILNNNNVQHQDDSCYGCTKPRKNTVLCTSLHLYYSNAQLCIPTWVELLGICCESYPLLHQCNNRFSLFSGSGADGWFSDWGKKPFRDETCVQLFNTLFSEFFPPHTHHLDQTVLPW